MLCQSYGTYARVASCTSTLTYTANVTTNLWHAHVRQAELERVAAALATAQASEKEVRSFNQQLEDYCNDVEQRLAQAEAAANGHANGNGSTASSSEDAGAGDSMVV
jgi:flagellar hook-basal body complex protein FliE